MRARLRRELRLLRFRSHGVRAVRQYVPAQEHVGGHFERLTILSVCIHNGRSHALCLCDCGKYTRAQVNNVVSGWTRSCGCLQEEIASTVGKMSTARALGGTAKARFIASLKARLIVARSADEADEAREVERVLESMGAEVPA